TILLTQRTRELALLRCVGAGRAQVFRSVLAESLSVGIVAAVLGCLAGAGLAAATVGVLRNAPLGDIPVDELAVEPWALAVPLVIGVATTAVAAAFPAWRATSVAPLAALRPEAAVSA